MFYRSCGLLLLLVFFSNRARSQQRLQGFEMLELVKISEVYKEAPHLSFNTSYTYADSANSAVVLEQQTGSTKISGGKFWSRMDSTEYLKGYQYTLGIDHVDTVITISLNPEVSNVLQLPLLDSLFKEANLSSMRVDSLNDSTNMLSVQFGPSSSYKQYKLYYHPHRFLVSKIEYYLSEYAPDPAEGLSGTSIITVLFTQYSDLPIDQAVFKEDVYFFKVGKEFFVTPAYSNYSLVINIVD